MTIWAPPEGNTHTVSIYEVLPALEWVVRRLRRAGALLLQFNTDNFCECGWRSYGRKLGSGGA
jgi:hypothetical protein